MAKKTKYESNNFDIDSELDLPDFDFGSDTVTNDRNPMRTAAKATLRGAANAALNPSVIRSTIRKSMPKEYGDALDLTDHATASMRSLYDTAAKEFRPVANDLKRITGKVVPNVEGVLPKKLADALKKWAKTDGSRGVDLSAERQRDDSIVMELGTIFKAQAEAQDKKDKSNQRHEEFKQGIDQIRHRDQIGQLDSIRVGIDRLAAYQDNVLSGYQKKSLELQFRQYFATVDLLETQKKAATDIETKLAGILKNTGLPEYVKINESERFAELTRNKFYSDIRDNLFGGGEGSAYIKQYMDNIKKSLTGKIQGAAQGMSQATFMLDMMTDGAGGEGPSKAELAGGIAGGALGDYAVGRGQKWLKRKLKDNPGLNKTAQNIGYRINNSGQVMNDYFNDPNTNWGGLEFLRNFLDENRPGVSPATMLDADSLSEMHKPQPFTKATQKSIIEIIPGYLARIHRELQVMRTGDTSIGLSTYDFEANKFSTDKGIGSKLIGDIAGKDNQEMVRGRQDELLSFIDPEGKFTDVQKKAVREQMLRMSLRRSSTDSIHLTNAATWRGAGKGAHGIAEAFSGLLEADYDGRRGDTLNAIQNQNRISDSIRGLTSGMGDPRARMQEMINAGQYDVLRNSGLIDDDNRISLNNLAMLLSGEDPNSLYQGGGMAANGRDSGFRSVKRTPRRNSFNQRVSRLDMSGSNAAHDSELLVRKLTSLEETAKAPPTLEPIKTIAEMVTSIEKRLAQGLIVYGDTTGQIGWEDFHGPRAPDWISKQVAKVRRSWSDISIGEIGSGLSKVGLKGLAIARREGGRIASRARGILNAGRSMVMGGLQNRADQMGDVYVGDESHPRLTHARMLAGEYFDKTTGAVLTSLHDIKGEVVDKGGNLVLSLEDLKTAYVKGEITEYLKDKVRGLGALIARGTVYAGGMVKGLYGHAIQGALMGVDIIKKNLPPYDVYVSDQMDQPVLYASQFRLSHYYSQKTGEVLRHPREIDGPVLDQDGNIIVTQDMLQQGLVDRNGIAVSNFVGRFMHKVQNLAGIGLNVLKKFGMTAKNFALGAFSSIGELFKGLFHGFSYYGERYVEINKDQLDVQMAILKLLEERLPKRAIGDTDGDGDREGSVMDIIKRRQAEKDAKASSLAGKASQAGGGFGSGMAGLFGSLSGLLKKNTEAVEEAAEAADGGLLDDAADAAGIADAASGDGSRRGRSRKGAGKAGGRLSKLARGAGQLGSRALGAVGRGGAMAAGAAANFFGLKGLGGLGGALGKGASLAGRTALGVGRAGLGLAGMAGRAGMWALANGGTLNVARLALMGLAGALTSPVSLVALGLTGAYYGYKYLTRKTLQPLNKVRYVQYGFLSSDTDHFNAVFELEDKLESAVKLEGPTASLDEKKFDLGELMEPFGIKAEDKAGVRSWSTWFNSRFKPIFLAHKSALSVVKPEARLADVDGSKLKPEEKLRYLGATELPGGPYGVLTSPFKDLDHLGSDSRAVAAEVELARTEIEKEVKNTSNPGAATAATAAGAAALATSKDGKDGVSGEVKAVQDKAAAAGLASLAMSLNKPATQLDAGVKVSAQSNVSTDYLFTGEAGMMDALTVIRYKTYGLVTMDADKVRALRNLEVYVARNTSFEKDGAQYTQDVETLLETVKVHFGISGARSPRGHEWVKWFRARFLPAFLNFATAVQKAAKKTDIVTAERSLTPDQAIAVASATYSTTTTYNGRKMPVWNVDDVSPWENYPLNNDDKSIDLNMEALKETAKAVVRGEHTSKVVAQKVAENRAKAGIKDLKPTNQAGKYHGSAARNNPWGGRNPAESSIYGNNGAELLRGDGQNVRAAGEYMTGVPVKHPGAGTGGDINSLPNVTGSGWQAVKPLLLAVAKMTGVDPKVLVNMAAIESGFDPNARAKTSSATGLFQFIKGTWAGEMRKNAQKYGIAIGTPPTDARANALMGAEFIKSNMEYLKNRIKRPLTATDVYLAHFLGPAGAAKFLSMDPNTPAATVMPDEANANKGVFFDRSGRMRTAGEIYKFFSEKMANQGKKFGVNDAELSGSAVAAQDSLVKGESIVADAPGGAQAPLPGSQPAKPSAAGAVVAAANLPAKTAATAPTSMVPGAAPQRVTRTEGPSPGAPQPDFAPPPAATSNFGRFQPNTPSSSDLRAMGEGNRPQLAQGIGDMNRTLQESLGVHKGSYALLQQILERLPSSMKSGTASQAASVPQMPKEAPKPAVDMSRSG